MGGGGGLSHITKAYTTVDDFHDVYVLRTVNTISETRWTLFSVKHKYILLFCNAFLSRVFSNLLRSPHYSFRSISIDFFLKNAKIRKRSWKIFKKIVSKTAFNVSLHVNEFSCQNFRLIFTYVFLHSILQVIFLETGEGSFWVFLRLLTEKFGLWWHFKFFFSYISLNKWALKVKNASNYWSSQRIYRVEIPTAEK